MSRPTIEEGYLRHCMLFLFDQGLKANEAVKKINDIYGDVLKLNKCHRWFKKFKNENRNLEDVERKGRLQKLDDEILRAMVNSDPRQTIRELSLKIGCPWSTVQDHLHRIGKVYRQEIWVLHELTETALDQRRTICASLLSRYETDPFLRRIVLDPRQTIRELSLKIGCPWSTVQDHLHRIGKVYRQEIWVLHELTETALDQRRTICASLLSR
ncbi:PREDICTED: histone-lysine N-methyltransferase SETMAR-like, partial [Dinoponera quadriceps]|uniref:Histone-lysine N-methyltransferase SETMAR-like n=1 Tax=Dinoponera quadriceps TaxID=609295 RepID=A0A6P3Y8Z8_DINQU